jgi:hypothetical protein
VEDYLEVYANEVVFGLLRVPGTWNDVAANGYAVNSPASRFVSGYIVEFDTVPGGELIAVEILSHQFHARSARKSKLGPPPIEGTAFRASSAGRVP